MRAHYAAMDGARLAEMMAELDVLGSDILIENVEYRISTKTKVAEYRALMNLLRDRIMLAPTDALVSETQRACDLIATHDRVPLISLLVRIACDSIIASAIAFRLDDLRMADDGSIARRLAGFVADGPEILEAGTTGEWLYMFEALHEPVARLGILIAVDDDWPSFFGPAFARAGRANVGRVHLRGADLCRVHLSPRDLLAQSRRLEADLAALLGRMPWNHFARQIASAWDFTFRMYVKRQMLLALIVAELDGDPWPEDAYGTGPLKRVERDGRTLAAYSVGPDGVDDGCNAKKDLVFELYGTVAPLKPTP